MREKGFSWELHGDCATNDIYLTGCIAHVHVYVYVYARGCISYVKIESR